MKEAGTLRAWLAWLLQAYGQGHEPIRIQAADIETMASRAVSNVNAQTNPRRATEDEIAAIYRETFDFS